MMETESVETPLLGSRKGRETPTGEKKKKHQKNPWVELKRLTTSAERKDRRARRKI